MKAKTPLVKHERLLDLLAFEPETGVFRWKVDRNQRIKAGDIAGTLHHSGYTYIRLDGEKILSHRLAWFFVHGEWADALLDHIDGDRANNTIANLREASPISNAQNQRKARRDNSTGLLGVTYRASNGKYAAQINIDGKNRHLGYFKDKEAAHQAYLIKKRQHHEGCVI